ncbi:hypothetical protein VTK56DRAFT_1355 [Thermocarpiscus australiensis]
MISLVMQPALQITGAPAIRGTGASAPERVVLVFPNPYRREALVASVLSFTQFGNFFMRPFSVFPLSLATCVSFHSPLPPEGMLHCGSDSSSLPSCYSVSRQVGNSLKSHLCVFAAHQMAISLSNPFVFPNLHSGHLGTIHQPPRQAPSPSHPCSPVAAGPSTLVDMFPAVITRSNVLHCTLGTVGTYQPWERGGGVSGMSMGPCTLSSWETGLSIKQVPLPANRRPAPLPVPQVPFPLCRTPSAMCPESFHINAYLPTPVSCCRLKDRPCLG